MKTIQEALRKINESKIILTESFLDFNDLEKHYKKHNVTDEFVEALCSRSNEVQKFLNYVLSDSWDTDIKKLWESNKPEDKTKAYRLAYIYALNKPADTKPSKNDVNGNTGLRFPKNAYRTPIDYKRAAERLVQDPKAYTYIINKQPYKDKIEQLCGDAFIAKDGITYFKAEAIPPYYVKDIDYKNKKYLYLPQYICVLFYVDNENDLVIGTYYLSTEEHINYMNGIACSSDGLRLVNPQVKLLSKDKFKDLYTNHELDTTDPTKEKDSNVITSEINYAYKQRLGIQKPLFKEVVVKSCAELEESTDNKFPKLNLKIDLDKADYSERKYSTNIILPIDFDEQSLNRDYFVSNIVSFITPLLKTKLYKNLKEKLSEENWNTLISKIPDRFKNNPEEYLFYVYLNLRDKILEIKLNYRLFQKI